MKTSLRERLEQVAGRYEEVGLLLSEPDVFSDANRFRDLSRDRDEPVQDVPLLGILEGPSGARRAAHAEIVANNVSVHASRCCRLHTS